MQRTCAPCGTPFEIVDGDLSFYDRVSPILGEEKLVIPPPTHCPNCRRQRKLAWRNERTLYQRTCNLCEGNIVSVHAPDNPYPVFCNPCWWSDRWNPLEFGQPYNPSLSFFTQYKELYSRVPQRAMVNDDGVTSENCAYTFDVAFAKNCYLCFGMWKCQDCYYCRICDQSRFCVDCEGVKLGSELVYESLDSQRLYHCAFLQNSENCTDCFFGFDLKSCSNCIACFGLRQKQYHILNKPSSREEYQEKLASIVSYSSLEQLKSTFAEWIRKFPRKNMNLQNCEDCLGDHLFHCRDVVGYVCTNAEHSRWIERSDGPLWCYDQVQSGTPQWCLECITVDNGFMNLFSLYCNQSHNILYSDNCPSCDSLFGCISLRRKKECILNRQYSKETYEELVPKITEHMRRTGEWGEFFPVSLSPFGYNETNAAEFYPLSEKEAHQRGWKWRRNLPYTTGKETVAPKQLPDNITDIPTSITTEILACVSCTRNYRIISQELDFYKKLSLPLPRRCPDCRNRDRLSLRNPQKLWQRKCDKCGNAIPTTYAPDRAQVVYCEGCYLKTVY